MHLLRCVEILMYFCRFTPSYEIYKDRTDKIMLTLIRSVTPLVQFTKPLCICIYWNDCFIHALLML